MTNDSTVRDTVKYVLSLLDLIDLRQTETLEAIAAMEELQRRLAEVAQDGNDTPR